MNKIRGILPVLHTPINTKGSVDITSLTNLVKFLGTKSIGGLWILGTGGEDMNLTFQERRTVVETVVDANQGRIPLLVGTSFECFKDSLRFNAFLSTMNIHGVHFLPYHRLLSLDRVEWMYSELLKNSAHPLWAYTSANYGRPLSPSFIKILKEKKLICGVKYSTSNTSHMTEVAALSDTNFAVISAVATTLYSSLCLGVDAATSSVASPLPEVLIDIYELTSRGDHKNALIKQRIFNEFMSAWSKDLASDNFLKGAEEKVILKHRGVIETCNMTSYFRHANKQEESNILALLQKYYPQLSGLSE